MLLHCLSDTKTQKSGADPLKYPSQILCLSESIIFTEKCEQAIISGKLINLLKSLKVSG